MNSQEWFEYELTRRSLVGGAAATAAAFLAGCGGSSNQPSGAPVSKARRGGTAQVGIPTDVIPDQFLRLTRANNAVGGQIFDHLTEYDPKTFEPQPALAESWELADDGTTVRLTLRRDVKFHSGRPFGPKDVLFALQTVQAEDSGSQVQTSATVISDMAASGADGVTLRLAHPLTNLFDIFQFTPILDEESLEDTLKGTNVVGTGPFVWKNWTPGASLTLARNENYWKKGQPYLDGVEVRVIEQSQALLSGLQAGQVQLAIGLAPRDLVSLRENDRFTVKASDSGAGTYYVGCNTKIPPFDRKEVRQAIAFAVDRARVLKQVFSDLGGVSSVWWPEGRPAYSEEAAGRYGFDPDKARQMIEAAGASGAKVPIAVNSGLPVMKSILEIVQFNLNEVGLEAEAVLYPGAEFVQRNANRDMPGLWINEFGQNHLNPVTLVKGAAPFNPESNTSNFTSPDYEGLVEEAWTAVSDEQENEANAQLTEFLLDEAFNINLVLSPQTAASSAELKDFGFTMLDDISLGAAHLA